MDPTYRGLSAPTPTKTRTNTLNLRPALFIGGGVLLLFVIVGLIANMLSPNTTTLSQRLLFRVDALNTLLRSAHTDIGDDSLAKINADLSIVVLGDSAALIKVIPAAKTTNELKAIKTEESDAATIAKLKTAKINGQYDDVYTAVLIQKIEAANALAIELEKKSSKSSVKTALATFKDHLGIYYTQLKSLN